MNGYIVRFLSIILVLFLVVYSGYQVYRFVYKPYETERAFSYTMTETVRTKGIVVRDEESFENNSAGMLSYTASDAEKITSGSVIGNIYDSYEQASAVQRIKELDEELSELVKITDPGSVVYVNTEILSNQINEKLGILVQLAATGDASGEISLRTQIQSLLNKKQLITGQVSGFSDRISNLKQEKEILAQQVGNNFETLKAPYSGYFARYCDGVENRLSLESVSKMPDTELNELISGKYSRDESLTGKIVKDHRWYFVSFVSKKDSEKFKTGSKVYLNFPAKRITDIPATIYSVTSSETGERYKIVLECDYISPGLLTLRSATAEISFKTYSGLRISSQAVRMVNGQAGVYVKTGYNIQFRPIRIIYQDSDFTLCGPVLEGESQMNILVQGQDQPEETETISNKPLEMFDEVIIGGTDIYDGKPII